MASNQNSSNPIAGAITYPSRSDVNAQTVPVQPRQPRNLQGLLRFAMEATKAGDAPGNSELGPMDEERRKFLEEALKSLTVDLAQVLQDAIKILTDSNKIHCLKIEDTLPDDVKGAFNNLLECIDDIDLANDFYKLGGFAIFPICFGSENDEVRTQASTVLAELCQNNPYCQSKVLECGLLGVLLNLAQTERGNSLAKCLYAISCATREYEPAYEELKREGGCGVLARLLRAPEPPARTKAAFLISHLCRAHHTARELFLQENVVDIITKQIKLGRDDTTEHLLSVISTLVENLDPRVLRQCRAPSTQLQKVLEDHLNHPDLQTDRHQEEKDYCKHILSRVFENCPPMDDYYEETADR